jgi:hypothetical protein
MDEAVTSRPTQITISIDPPLKFGGGDFSQLVLHEPTAGEVLLGEMQIKGGVNAWTLRNRMMHMVAKCAGVPFPVVEMLPMTTFNKAWSFIHPFYETGLETTGN